MAKVFKKWDVDKFEDEIPRVMIAEWNEYFDYEISQYTEAILGIIPAANSISESGAVNHVITDPEEKMRIFEVLGAK